MKVLDFILNKDNGYKITGWHAALFVVGVNILARILQSPEKIKEEYEEQDQAPWAPPAGVFGPAWLFNNATMAAGAVRLINKPYYPNKTAMLVLQGLMWVNYTFYNKLSYGLKKPSNIISALATDTFMIMSIISLYLAIKGGDKKIILSYVPVTLWTTFASTLAGYTALENEDKLFEINPKEKILELVGAEEENDQAS